MVAIYLDHFQAIDKESDVKTIIAQSEDNKREATEELVDKA